MPLPNTSGIQNAGVNPNDVQQKNDVTQAMNNFFREFSSRMDNILNVRGNVQAGVFNSFGNNVLTRGGTQITDLLTDTIKDLFSEKEEEKDDPTVKALKAQFEVLKDISNTMYKVNDHLFDIDEATYGIRLDIKNQGARGSSSKLLSDSGVVDASEDLNFPKLDIGLDQAIPKSNFVNDTEPLANFLRAESVDPVTDIEEATKKQTSTLERILSVLLSSDKKLEKLVNDGPISTREGEIEASRIKSSIGGLTGSEGSAQPQEKSWLTILDSIGSIMSGIKDFGIILGTVTTFFSRLPKLIFTTFAGIFAAIKTQIPTIFNAIKSLFTKGFMGILGSLTIALAPLMAMFGVKNWAETASIRDESGELTATGAVLDTTQKVLGNEQGLTPMSDMTGAEKIAANADTGFLGLSSGKKDAYKKKYRDSIAMGAQYSEDEADALTKHFGITVPSNQIKKVQADVSANITTIERGQDELRKAQQSKAAPAQQVRPIVQNNNTSNNQTIMPTRSFPTNTEPGYRRYMDNMLQGG